MRPAIKRVGIITALLVISHLIVSCAIPQPVASQSWKDELHSALLKIGYRNWIVVADASFPLHSQPGIDTIIVPVEIPETVDQVIRSIDQTQHISPSFYTSRELQFVRNNAAPGITQFKATLEQSLHGYHTRSLEENLLLESINNTKKHYSVLVIKTATALPYSSVFIELDSGYWDSQSEQKLRGGMNHSLSQLKPEE